MVCRVLDAQTAPVRLLAPETVSVPCVFMLFEIVVAASVMIETNKKHWTAPLLGNSGNAVFLYFRGIVTI